MYSLLVRYGTDNLLYLVASPHLVAEMEDITPAQMELKVVLAVVVVLLVVVAVPLMELLGEHLIVIHHHLVGEIVEQVVTQHHAVVAVAVLELLPLETSVVLV